jgi:hypothetical protein
MGSNITYQNWLIRKINIMKRLKIRFFNRKSFQTIISFSILIIIIFTPIIIDETAKHNTKIEPEINLWNSIRKYESKYIKFSEDQYYGYIIDIGYPMYLFNLGEMYYWMYNYSGNEYYKNKFLRGASYVYSIINEDWTWNSIWRGRPNNLYNSMAVSLFLKVFEITKNVTFLDYAYKAILPLLRENLVKLSNINNDKFIAFTVIAEFISISQNYNISLITAGKQFYNYSISQYNKITKKWFYNEKEQETNIYNGHSAFYQLVNIYSFLKREEAIKEVFPTEFNYLEEEIQEMIPNIIEYISENGTFYYKIETPDYTESAADILITLELFDQKYRLQNYDVRLRVQEIILQRQLNNGAFLRTGSLKDSYRIWYTDNIGRSVMHYLNIASIRYN